MYLLIDIEATSLRSIRKKTVTLEGDHKINRIQLGNKIDMYINPVPELDDIIYISEFILLVIYIR